MSVLGNTVKSVLLWCCLPLLLGANSDSPGAATLGAEQKTSEVETAVSRQTRQSYFSNTDITKHSEPYSFQRFSLGADAPSELQHPPELQLPTPDPTPPQPRDGRQFTLNDLNFEGFQFSSGFNPGIPPPQRPPPIQPAFQSFQPASQSQTPKFQPLSHFQPTSQFQSVPRTRPVSQTLAPTFQRTRQRSEPAVVSAPTVSQLPRLPPNADPRVRHRGTTSQPTPPPPSTSTPTTSLSPSPTTSLSSNSQILDSEGEQETSRTVGRTRKRLKLVTKAPVVKLEQLNLEHLEKTESSQEFPAFSRNFKFKKEEEEEVVTENPIIARCLKETEKHALEIEELQNRTALHIEYAQEKQIQIQTLEELLEEARLKKQMDKLKLQRLQSSVKNLTDVTHSKDDEIRKMEDYLETLKNTFNAATETKNDNIRVLTLKLQNATMKIEEVKENLKAKTKENKITNFKLKGAISKVNKLKSEKKNLLDIVQQLAEIGNPVLNFNAFFEPTENNFDTFDDITDLEDKVSEEVSEITKEIDLQIEKIPEKIVELTTIVNLDNITDVTTQQDVIETTTQTPSDLDATIEPEDVVEVTTQKDTNEDISIQVTIEEITTEKIDVTEITTEINVVDESRTEDTLAEVTTERKDIAEVTTEKEDILNITTENGIESTTVLEEVTEVRTEDDEDSEVTTARQYVTEVTTTSPQIEEVTTVREDVKVTTEEEVEESEDETSTTVSQSVTTFSVSVSQSPAETSEKTIQ